MILPLVGEERCSSADFCLLFSQMFHLTGKATQSITSFRSSYNSFRFLVSIGINSFLLIKAGLLHSWHWTCIVLVSYLAAVWLCQNLLTYYDTEVVWRTLECTLKQAKVNSQLHLWLILYHTWIMQCPLQCNASGCSTVPPSVWHSMPVANVRSCSTYCYPSCCCFLKF